MSEPFYGEIRIFAGNYAPVGWFFCDGSLLAIAQYETLFQLIGTTYGGDGETTFALPDLRGRLPMDAGTGSGLSTRIVAQSGGSEAITLTQTQLPTHTHSWQATNNAGIASTPVGNAPAIAQGDLYTAGFTPAIMSPQAVNSVGGNQPHSNLQPFLCVNFIISYVGIYPSAP